MKSAAFNKSKAGVRPTSRCLSVDDGADAATGEELTELTELTESMGSSGMESLHV